MRMNVNLWQMDYCLPLGPLADVMPRMCSSGRNACSCTGRDVGSFETKFILIERAKQGD